MYPSMLIDNVRIPGVSGRQILVRDGRIAAIGPDLGPPEPDTERLDARGGIAVPGFVDVHAHLDKTTWGLPYRPNSAGPTLEELTDNERRSRGELGASAEERAYALMGECVRHGTSFIRSHVDVDTEAGLSSVAGVAAAARRMADQVNVEIVAFPQSGLLRRPGTADMLEQAIKEGAQVIGGIDPAGFDQDPVRHLDVIFGIAARHGVPVDIHLHDPGELGAWEIELIAERTRVLGLAGQVTISHAFALATVPERRQGQLADLLAARGVNIATAAAAAYPMIPVGILTRAGVTVGLGNDGIRDLWSPFGSGDMLERAMIVAQRCGLRHDEDLEHVVNLATYGGSRILGLRGYGLVVGSHADLVIIEGRTLGDALALHAPRIAVLKGGIATVNPAQRLG